MVQQKITIKDLSDDENATLGRLVDKLAAKKPRNLLRASYYDGKRAIRQVGTVIPPQYYRLAIVLGWSGKAVDLLARRCNLDRMIWPDGNINDLGIQSLFAENQTDREINASIISSLIHATSFLVTIRGQAGEPPVQIHVRDAMAATGEWNVRTRSLDNLLSVTSRDDQGEITGFTLYLNNLTITASKEKAKWSVDRSTHIWGVPAEPMVYKYRTGREFGSSRISRPSMSLHDQAVRELIRLEGHMDVYSYPEMWMLGADEKIFKNPDGSQKPAWQVMLGRIKGLPDDPDRDDNLARADVKQFPASSPQPHLAALNAFAKLFARETQLPDTALAITDVSNPTSAESYDASQYELIAEAEGACDDWATPLRKTVTRALAMANGLSEIPAEWATIAPKWRDPRYLSRAAEADAGVKQLSAVPWLADTEVGLELLGLDEQQMVRALAEKRRMGASAALEAIRGAAERTRGAVSGAGDNGAI